ncbi:uncharacterized protein BKCO1_5000188 [Diplodia corticola]|uniref:BTB domain-containing protein n=1 Tax=Diplodia corticola TaxID=236234 RepID=A0A1J9SBT7_9PEZI|nr:uncharacterized protein BKCO1_5000188 [Diplodia corticola]OJD37935.1 hypothetical protein BKCO1_5000188 [Diplodia corticola]
MSGESSHSRLKRPLAPSERSDRKPKRQSFDDDHKQPVDVRVGTGSEAETFHCFAPLLKRYSHHFKTQLGDIKVEAGLDVPSYPISIQYLPNEQPADFSLFREYMENPRFFTIPAEVERKKPYDLAQLYYFANRIGAWALENACINCLYLKVQQSVSRLKRTNKRNKSLVDNVILSWKQTTRSVINHQKTHQDNSRLYKFVIDFFAFFVLQTAPLLEESLISDLPNPFLWHVLCALENALARHVPDLPTPSTATVATIDDKVVTVVHIIDSDDDEDTLLGPSSHHVNTTTTASTDEGVALGALPKSDLVSKILLLSGVLRALVGGKLTKPKPPKKRGRPAKDCNDEESDNVSTSDSTDNHEKSSFFGVSNLCKYHVHTPAGLSSCKQRFEETSAEEVWPVVPSLRK